jgi:hypothetical protein
MLANTFAEEAALLLSAFAEDSLEKLDNVDECVCYVHSCAF